MALNRAASLLEVVGLEAHLDGLTLIENGVRIEGALALPDAMGGVKVDFSGDNFVAITTGGIVYDIDVTASNVNLDLSGFSLQCQHARLLLSNATGPHVGVLTGIWSVDILGTPVEVNLDTAEGNYFRFDSNGDWDLNGSLTVGRIEFTSSLYTDGFFIDVDTANSTYYGEGSLTIPVGNGLTVSAHAGIMQGYFDNAGIELIGLNIPVWTPPPISIDRLRGDVWHLAPDEVDGTATLIEVGVGIQLGPDIGDYNLLYLDLDGWLDLGGGLGGEATLLVGDPDAPFASGTVSVDWRPGESVTLAGNLTAPSPLFPAAIISVDGEFSLDSNNSLLGNVTGTVQAPAWAGGWSLANVDGAIRSSDDGDDSNDIVIVGGEIFGGVLKKAVSMNLNTGDFNWFAAYEELEQYMSPASVLAMDSLVTTATASAPYDFIIPMGLDSALFSISWDQADTDIHLVDPSGFTFTPENVGDDPNVDYHKNTLGTEAFFEVISPIGGNWQVVVTEVDGIGDYTVQSYASSVSPIIDILEPGMDTTESTIDITWTDEDSDSDATISLYYDTDRQGGDGMLIVSGIDENDDTDAYSWDTADVPTGNYYVYAVIDDGVNVPVVSYSSGRVSVVDANSPDAPTNLAAVEIVAADAVRLTWTAPGATDVDHYLVHYAADAGGEFYQSTFSPGDATTAVLEGISPGVTHRATVAAVDVSGHVSVNAEPVVFTIGESIDEVFAVTGDTYTVQVTGSEGDTFFDISLPVGASMEADGAITWAVPADAEGWYEILVHVTDTAGEKTVWRRYILVDTDVPSIGAASPTAEATAHDTISITVPGVADVSGVPWYRLERDGEIVVDWQQSTTFTDTGLAANTTYTYRYEARDNSPELLVGDWSSPFAVTTLAAIPTSPVLSDPAPDGATLVALGFNLNPTDTEYSVFCTTTGTYLQADGTLSVTPDWQPSDAWDDTVIIGLESDTPYYFEVTARNADGLEAGPGAATMIVTDRENDPPTVLDAQQLNGHGSVGLTFSEPVPLYASDLEVLVGDGTTISIDSSQITQSADKTTAVIDLSGSGLAVDTTYQLCLKGNAVQDYAANLLDGEYADTFPSGDGQAGGDFLFSITTYDNDPPIADAGGSYSVPESGVVQLDASDTTDPNLPDDTLTYAWDFDGDGDYDDATGISPDFSAATLDGPTTVYVGLEVTDQAGETDTATAEVTITNTASALLDFRATAVYVSGESVLTGTISEPCSVDTFTLVVDWGDGSPAETFSYPAGTTTFSETHPYAHTGSAGDAADEYTITTTLEDDDSGSDTETTTVIVGSEIPTVDITSTPTYGSDGLLQGVVTGVDFEVYQIATYIYVDGSGWWTKPTFATPGVTINPDGSFAVDVVAGGLDAWATIYCTAVLPSDLPVPIADGDGSLPAELASVAVAVDYQERYGRTLEFAGYTWAVKEAVLPVGPGLNRFSSDETDVWVDDEGLHLTISYHDSQWWSTEVVLLDSLGYGTYSIQTDSRNDILDANAVFGAFTWDAYGDDEAIPDWPYREIDIEDSRWGEPTSTLNSQFVVQPWEPAGHRYRYELSDLDADSSLTRLFNWQPSQIEFVTLEGYYSPDDYPTGAVFDQWTYSHDPGSGLVVPEAGREQFRLNLWLYGDEPIEGETVEVVIRDFAHFSAGGPYAITEGEDLTLDAGSWLGTTDEPVSYVWDLDDDGNYDDASGESSTVPWNTLAALELASDGSALPIRVQASDDGNVIATGATTLTIDNVAPATPELAVTTVNEGEASTVTGAVVDPGTLDTFALAIDWGDGTVEELVLANNSISIGHDYGDSGEYTGSVTVRDNDGDESAYPLTVTVRNVAPTAVLSNDGPVNEGSLAEVSFAEQFDPSGEDTSAGFIYSFDFDNDGTFEIQGSSVASADIPVQYLADGPATRTVLGRIEDEDGGFRDYTTSIQVNNLPPVAEASGPYSVGEGSALTLNGEGTDAAGVSDSLTYAWDFDGDGQYDDAFGASPAFSATGLDGPIEINVGLKVTDDDGAQHNRCCYD